MDFSNAQNQVTQVEQQSQALIQNIQSLAQKLKAAAPDEATGREWAMDLREIAMSVRSENQMLEMLVGQMGQYIQTLEAQLQHRLHGIGEFRRESGLALAKEYQDLERVTIQ